MDKQDRQAKTARAGGRVKASDDSAFDYQALKEQVDIFRLCLDHVHDIVYAFDTRLCIRYVSPSSKAFVGYKPEEIIGRPLKDFHLLTRESARRAAAQIRRVLKGEPIKSMELTFIARDGTHRIGEGSGAPYFVNGKRAGIVGVIQDITERKRVEKELRFHTELEGMITFIATEFINAPSTAIDAYIDRALESVGRFLKVDRSYAFRFRGKLSIMDNTHEWCADGIESHIDRLQDLRTEDFPWFTGKMRNWEVVNIPHVASLPPEAASEKKEFEREGIRSLICVPMLTAQEVIGFLGFDSVREDRLWPPDIIRLLKMLGGIIALAMERKKTEEKLEHMAYSDSLTGLPNRPLFFDRLAQALVRARRRQQSLAVLFIDLDRFKSVNDTSGHDVGDMLLKQAAQRLRSCVREEDTIARMGGDEFTVILTDLEKPEHAALVCRKILACMTEPFVLKGQRFSIGCSIGIAVYPEDGKDSETLLKCADTAMYRAKLKGNECCFYAYGAG